ncbi:MAG TPA: helix-turn-helix domain-containing protein [Gammaproteobacteria bacterium]|nr:helix-turn-helix domain-containing protein [Gammaproteobacteria bacterium]
MKHFQRIKNALEFIEENLYDEFTLNDISNAAFSSLSYMHRIFYQMTGFTMKEYIRQRRLAEAVSLLQSSKKSVLDIALIAGYQSAESFTRAFYKQFSMTPSDCRRGLEDVIVCQPLDLTGDYTFISSRELDFELTLEAVSLPAFCVKGFMIRTTLQDDQQTVDICEFAEKIIQSGKMIEHFDLSRTPLYGMYTEMTDQSEFKYTIAGLSHACFHPVADMVTHRVESSVYAKFTLNRNDRIKEAWHYIYGSWFPQVDDLRSQGFDFEIYKETSTSIYIPMQKVPIGYHRAHKL